MAKRADRESVPGLGSNTQPESRQGRKQARAGRQLRLAWEERGKRAMGGGTAEALGSISSCGGKAGQQPQQHNQQSLFTEGWWQQGASSAVLGRAEQSRGIRGAGQQLQQRAPPLEARLTLRA